MSKLLNDLEKSAAINRSDLNHAIINRKQREIQSGLDDLMNDSPIKQSPKPKFKASDKKTKYVSAYNKTMAEKKTPINPEVKAFIDRAKERQQSYADARGRIEDMGANVKKILPSDAPKSVSPTPDLPKSNRNRNIGLGLTGAAAATGTGLYAYNRYKKKKRAEAEEEKTAAAPKREEVVQRRKLASSLKKKVKKKGVKKLKKGIHKPVRQKKTANFTDTELEKIASLMADQFIAATSLQNVDPDNMNFEQEVLAGYKSFIDEVNVDGVE